MLDFVIRGWRGVFEYMYIPFLGHGDSHIVIASFRIRSRTNQYITFCFIKISAETLVAELLSLTQVLLS